MQVKITLKILKIMPENTVGNKSTFGSSNGLLSLCNKTLPGSMSQYIVNRYVSFDQTSIDQFKNKASRERQHPSFHRSENGHPINGPTAWKLQQSCIHTLLDQCVCSVLSPTGKPILQIRGCIVAPASYRLTSLSFQVKGPSHSWDKVNWKFNIDKTQA